MHSLGTSLPHALPNPLYTVHDSVFLLQINSIMSVIWKKQGGEGGQGCNRKLQSYLWWCKRSCPPSRGWAQAEAWALVGGWLCPRLLWSSGWCHIHHSPPAARRDPHPPPPHALLAALAAGLWRNESLTHKVFTALLHRAWRWSSARCSRYCPRLIARKWPATRHTDGMIQINNNAMTSFPLSSFHRPSVLQSPAAHIISYTPASPSSPPELNIFCNDRAWRDAFYASSKNHKAAAQERQFRLQGKTCLICDAEAGHSLRTVGCICVCACLTNLDTRQVDMCVNLSMAGSLNPAHSPPCSPPDAQ